MSSFNITKRELKGNLLDISSYALVAAFLAVAIYFFFNLLGSYNQAVLQAAQLPVTDLTGDLNLNTWVINSYFQTLLFLLVLFIPAISAASLAQERTRGTLELLLTLPISAKQIVLGKFMSAWFLIAGIILLASLLPFSLVLISNPELAPILSGLVGLLLTAAAFSAISLACSALVRNSIFAGVLALAILLLAYSIHMPAETMPERMQVLLRYLSPLWQLRDLLAGVITFKPFAYFFSITVLGLVLAIKGLDAQRLRV